MATFFDPRKRPTAVQVHVSTGRGLDINWGDGHASHYDFVYLREKCPCATCNEEREKKAAAPVGGTGLPGLPGLGPALPMFKPKPTARQAKTVGQYALQFEFNDGHSTGIYSYDFLRTICPCEQCARDFRSEAPPQA